MNRLAGERSPYLKHAAGQKINWYPWCDEAFETARAKDCAVFLSSGAIWCHWCHVMAKECFDDEEIAKLLNDHFVSVKLDRDERPDIDRRYQNAVSAMGFGGGWPLSVFLTPDRKPFFGGTYFPPDDRPGRPGFRKVLTSVAEFYSSKRWAADEYSGRLIDSLKQNPLKAGEILQARINEAVINILSQFDPANGGFGSSPKFPASGAIELLINRFYFTQMQSYGYAVRKTLESMAKGGIHDQLGGGFHRYSVDESWIVPHFEKMADDNAWLLRNYLDAYAVFGDEYFLEVARGILRFLKNTLSEAGGGFYASQDADVSPDDEGGYFTWTEKELERVLNKEEYRIMTLHFFHERGAMHHDKAKKVLFVAMGEGDIAERTGTGKQKVLEIIRSGKIKLLEERSRRKAPFIDQTLYTSVNGMLITSFLKSYRVLKDSNLKEFALTTLRKILNKHFADNRLFHTEGIDALLDDYIYLIEALINAYEITGDSSYQTYAETMMALCLENFWDKETGGFFDTGTEVLGARLKGIEDIPHPSANSLGIIILLKLYSMTGVKRYNDLAETALKIFSLKTNDMGIHAGYYFCALDAYFLMLTYSLHTIPGHELAETALSAFYPYLSIAYREDKGSVIPCFKSVCFEPLVSPESIREFLREHVNSNI